MNNLYVDPEDYRKARAWNQVRIWSGLIVASCILLVVYILGWHFTYQYFWDQGWYYWAWVPWTGAFLFLLAIAIFLFSYLRLFHLQVRPSQGQAWQRRKSPDSGPVTEEPVVIVQPMTSSSSEDNVIEGEFSSSRSSD